MSQKQPAGPPPSYEETMSNKSGNLYPGLPEKPEPEPEPVTGNPADLNDFALIMKAADFAARRHRFQRRKDPQQTPYINHPIGVAHILTYEAGIQDPQVIVAALLHDTVEDTKTTFEEIKALFGEDILKIVQECTDDKSLPKDKRKQLQIDNAASHSYKARLVHLADKLYNLRDLERANPVGWSPKTCKNYVKWAKQVIDQIRGTNDKLEQELDNVISRLLANEKMIHKMFSKVLTKQFQLLIQNQQFSRMAMIETIEKTLADGQIRKPAPKPKIGVLLINTGTPEHYSFFSIWKYLRQFLTDPRMIEAPRFIWYPLLYLVILMIRPFKKGPSYKNIWNFVDDESPLRTISKNQSNCLQKRFDSNPEKIPVQIEWAFRYGNPSIPEKLKQLEKTGCDRLVAFPLFPHYSAATTASVCDEIFSYLVKQRRQMAVHTVHAYYRDETFIEAICEQIRKSVEEFPDFDAILVSYHGIPLSYELRGDPYGNQCKETTKLIQDQSKIDKPFLTCFQSKFGPNEWLKPYTEDLTVKLAKNGIKNLLIVTPGFSSDCLETLEELKIDLAKAFQENGGENLVCVPCLNDSESGMNVIEKIARKEIQGFL